MGDFKYLCKIMSWEKYRHVDVTISLGFINELIDINLIDILFKQKQSIHFTNKTQYWMDYFVIVVSLIDKSNDTNITLYYINGLLYL